MKFGQFLLNILPIKLMFKNLEHSHIKCNIIHISQDVETILGSINRKMDKENVRCLYNGIL